MKKAGIFFIGVLALCLFTTQAYAGLVQSMGVGTNATSQGNAFAAQADDAFAVYYNPAGLSRIDQPVFTAGANYYDAVVEISDFSLKSSVVPGEFNPGPANFESRGDGLVNPFMGFAMPITDKINFGVALYSPYGLHLKWDNNPANNPGALYAWESLYARVTLTPALSYKFSDKLSVGAGVSLGQSTSNAGKTYPVDAITGQTGPGVMSFLKLETKDDFNYSFNVGVMYKPIEKISLGLTYRSITHTDFKGTAYLETPSIGRMNAGTASMKYDHPQSVQGGIRYFFTENFSVETDLTWVNWSILKNQIEEIDFHPLLNANGMKDTAFTHKRNWEDTVQFCLGMEWKALENLAVRAGYTYDPTPVPNETYDFGWPDTDRKAYSLGLGWDINESFTLDAALQHVVSDPVRYVSGSGELNHVYGPIVQAASGNMIPADTVNTSFNAKGILWGYSMTLSYRF